MKIILTIFLILTLFCTGHEYAKLQLADDELKSCLRQWPKAKYIEPCIEYSEDLMRNH